MADCVGETIEVCCANSIAPSKTNRATMLAISSDVRASRGHEIGLRGRALQARQDECLGGTDRQIAHVDATDECQGAITNAFFYG